MGACQVEYLLQSLPCSDLLKEVIYLCENGLWRGLEATLGITPIPEAAWGQALVPVRLGGLGLRSPATVRSAARLAALVNVRTLGLLWNIYARTSKQRLMTCIMISKLHTLPVCVHLPGLRSTSPGSVYTLEQGYPSAAWPSLLLPPRVGCPVSLGGGKEKERAARCVLSFCSLLLPVAGAIIFQISRNFPGK